MWLHGIFFLIGGLLYQMVEILWRGYTHPSMFIVGGLCFVLLGLLNEIGPCRNAPLLVHMVLAAGIVTAVELLAGLYLVCSAVAAAELACNEARGLAAYGFREKKQRGGLNHFPAKGCGRNGGN